MKRASVVLVALTLMGLSGGWAFAEADIGALECFLECCRIGVPVEARSEGREAPLSLYRLELDSPVHWDLLDGGRKWNRSDLRPPLYQDVFPDPRRDPRLGSYSRSPITLRYWWE